MRRIIFLVYPGFQLLDVAGAAAAFSGVERQGTRPYQVLAAFNVGGVVQSGSGIAIETISIGHIGFTSTDTVIVPGAGEQVLRRMIADPDFITTLRTAARAAERFGAVGNGSFLLAAASLLDGKRAVTHWASRAEFVANYPDVTLLPDPIFNEDGGIWTSAGTTTGIDMALEMIKRDHGNAPAHDIARILRGRRARARLGMKDSVTE